MSVSTTHRLSCDRCFSRADCGFNRDLEQSGDFRIRRNPMTFGNPNGKVAVLGFSKGPNASTAIDVLNDEDVAYHKKRKFVGRILRHLRLIPDMPDDRLTAHLDALISDSTGPFHFGSVIRCGVERRDSRAPNRWKLTSGDMLGFVGTKFGERVLANCIEEHLLPLLGTAQLVILMGFGVKQSYARAAHAAIHSAYGGHWRPVAPMVSTNDQTLLLNSAHFASRNHLAAWLGRAGGSVEYRELGEIAREAVPAHLRVD